MVRLAASPSRMLILLALTGTLGAPAWAASSPPASSPAGALDRQAERVVEVEVEGEFIPGPNTMIAEAERGSLQEARRKAVEEAVGIWIKSSTVVRNLQLELDLVQATAQGVIVGEEILESGFTAEQHGSRATLVHRTRIRAQVKSIPMERAHGSFGVSVALNRSIFRSGDDAQIKVEPTEDAYVYVFNVTQDDAITILVPNRFAPDTHVPGGTSFVFPGGDLVDRGIKLRPMTPRGQIRATEYIKVVATKRPIDMLQHLAPEGIFQQYAPEDRGVLINLLRALTNLEPGEWAEATATYEVRAR